MQFNLIKYCIPVIISIIFICLILWELYYLILVILLVLNVFNVIWGRYNTLEVKAELKYFYHSPTIIFIKRLSALVFVCMLAIQLYALNRIGVYQQAAHYVFFTFCAGILTGCFVVTLAHDLLHSKYKFDRYLSSILLLISGIPHLAVDHVFGHHRNVGLSHDASTAKVNQNFYHYFFKIMIYRISQSYKHQYALPSYARKKIFNISILMTLAWALLLVIIFWLSSHGWMSIGFFMGQGFIAYVLYELINYIQHYGLGRKDASEPITQALSWNCYYKYTNYFLFLLPLHSLHHLPLAGRKVKDEEYCKAPTMPYLYFIMILMAMLPPIFFKKMNPLVRKFKSHES